MSSPQKTHVTYFCISDILIDRDPLPIFTIYFLRLCILRLRAPTSLRKEEIYFVSFVQPVLVRKNTGMRHSQQTRYEER